MSEIVCQHLYEGKVFDIWAAWQSDKPENYVLGRSQLEARENFALQLEIIFEQTSGGFEARCPRFKELVGRGPSTMKAEKHLMRQINLRSDRVDWREMFFELILALGGVFEWEKEMPWAEREKEIVWREVNRRVTAAQFNVQGTVSKRFSGAGKPNETALPKEGGYAETPFCD